MSLSRKGEPGRKITLRLEAELHSKLVAFAERDRRSLHAEVLILLEDAVSAEADRPAQVTLDWRERPDTLLGSGAGVKQTPLMKFVTVWLPDSLHSKLVSLAERDRRSLHAEIVVLLEIAVLALEGHTV